MGLIKRLESRLIVAVILWNPEGINSIADLKKKVGGVGLKGKMVLSYRHMHRDGMYYTIVKSRSVLPEYVRDGIRAGMMTQADECGAKNIFSYEDWIKTYPIKSD